MEKKQKANDSSVLQCHISSVTQDLLKSELEYEGQWEQIWDQSPSSRQYAG